MGAVAACWFRDKDGRLGSPPARKGSRMVADSLWWLFSFVTQDSGKIARLRSQMSRAP